MKNLLLNLAVGATMLASFFSCDESNLIGGSVQPDQDKISVFYDTVHVQSSTVFVDSILYRSSSAFLGEFTDPFFGTTKSDFLAQLYCPKNFSFPDDVKRIDSSFLYLYYEDLFGDSTTMLNIKVYEMSKAMDLYKPYYTNIDPTSYYNKSNLIGQYSVSPGDLYTSDSVKSLSSYQTVIKVPISLAIGNRFLKDSRTNPEKFAGTNTFADYFKGIYVTTNFGNGTIINIDHSELEFIYGTYKYSKTSGGLRDSFVVAGSYFPVTKEVRQVNRFQHPDLSYYLNPSDKADSLNYIFSPSGLYTKISIPDKVFQLINGSSVNRMRLKILATQQDESEYGMEPPKNMLLIRESDARSFFSRFELNDGLNSFLATYNSDTKTYEFNLSYYAQKMVRHMADPEKSSFIPFKDMLMIPVNVVTSTDGASVRLEQTLKPSAVKVRGAKHPTQPMKLELVYSKGKIN